MTGLISTPLVGNFTENRIVNGDFLLDQRNEGASVTPVTTAYNVDGWFCGLSQAGKITLQQVSDAPVPFLKSVLITSTSAYVIGAAESFSWAQRIEGPNIADCGFGAAGAATLMLTFWAKSSLTGVFSIRLSNSAANRVFITTYAIAVANTWTRFVIPVAGDVTGTWLTAVNTIGMVVTFDLGSGSTLQTGILNAWQAPNVREATGAVQLVANNGATLNIANVRLRKGTFDVSYTPLPFPQLLSICQRNFWKTFQAGTAPIQNVGSVSGAVTIKNPIALGDPSYWVQFPSTMMKAPTITTYNPSAANADWRDITAASDATVSVDPGTTVGSNGVLVATSGTVTTLGDILAIHLTAEAVL